MFLSEEEPTKSVFKKITGNDDGKNCVTFTIQLTATNSTFLVIKNKRS